MKKKIEKISFDEKQKQIIYSICILIVFVILLFGDAIAAHFVKTQNQKNHKMEVATVFEEVNIFTKITKEEVQEKIDAKDAFYLLSTRSLCYTCSSYIPILNKVSTSKNIEIYYIEKDSDTKKYFETISNKNEGMEKNIQYSPYLMYFENGYLKKDLVGNQTEEKIIEFIGEDL